jgi:hypothetical protein
VVHAGTLEAWHHTRNFNHPQPNCIVHFEHNWGEISGEKLEECCTCIAARIADSEMNDCLTKKEATTALQSKITCQLQQH